MTVVYEGVHPTGRQLCRNITSQEAVLKAAETTELLYAALEQRGWLLEMPAISELKTGDETKAGF
jgi:hypothetical protein